METMQVYYANLEAYNSGRMIGDWLKPSKFESLEDFEKAIKKVTKNADEVAVHDYDNFPNMGEYPSAEEIYNFAHQVKEVVDSYHFLTMDIIMEYIDAMQQYHGIPNFDEIDFNDEFIGLYDTLKDFAEWHAYDVDSFESIPEHMRRFFDWDYYAESLEREYIIITTSNYCKAVFKKY
jgi:antirestriction protein